MYFNVIDVATVQQDTQTVGLCLNCTLLTQNATCLHFHGQSHVSEVKGHTKAALCSHTVRAGQYVYNHDHNIMDVFTYRFKSQSGKRLQKQEQNNQTNVHNAELCSVLKLYMILYTRETRTLMIIFVFKYSLFRIWMAETCRKLRSYHNVFLLKFDKL